MTVNNQTNINQRDKNLDATLEEETKKKAMKVAHALEQLSVRDLKLLKDSIDRLVKTVYENKNGTGDDTNCYKTFSDDLGKYIQARILYNIFGGNSIIKKVEERLEHTLYNLALKCPRAVDYLYIAITLLGVNNNSSVDLFSLYHIIYSLPNLQSSYPMVYPRFLRF